MGWASRAKIRSGNPVIIVSIAGRVWRGKTPRRRVPVKVRGKALVKAAKRRRVYDENGRRVIA